MSVNIKKMIAVVVFLAAAVSMGKHCFPAKATSIPQPMFRNSLSNATLLTDVNKATRDMLVVASNHSGVEKAVDTISRSANTDGLTVGLVETADTSQTVEMLRDGKVEVALITEDVYDAERMYETEEFAVCGVVKRDPVVLAASTNSGITSIEDVDKDTRIAVVYNSGDERAFYVWGWISFAKKKYAEAQYRCLGSKEAMAALAAGEVDLVVDVGENTYTFDQVLTNPNVRLVPLSESLTKGMNQHDSLVYDSYVLSSAKYAKSRNMFSIKTLYVRTLAVVRIGWVFENVELNHTLQGYIDALDVM